MKRTWSIVLCVAVLSTFCFSSVSATTTVNPIDESMLVDNELLKLMENTYIDQREAVTAYENLVESFGYNEVTGEVDYPDDYGGAYINDNAELVVLIKDISSEKIQQYTTFCQDNIITKNADYALVELKSVVADLPSIVGDYDFYGIDEVNNEVDVYIDPAINSVATLQELSNYPLEIIYEGVQVEDTVSISSGGKLYTNSDNFSLSAWATLSDGTVGMITCGHVFMSSGSFLSSSANVYASSAKETVVGTASSSKTFDTGNYDCAFITKTSSIYTPTATMVPGGSLTSVGSVATGTYVYKYGAADGMAYGYVQYSESGYDNHTNFYTIDAAHNSSCFGTTALGDSGGPIYTVSTTGKVLVGIVMGRQGSGEIFYGSRADYAFNKLNATLYT